MQTKPKNRTSWTGIPPWVLIGAVAVLLPIFTFITIENINRQKKKSTRLLLEKGAALIRSFEAGTRTGMMGMHRGGFRLQLLLTEMARQPDIIYLYVADINGRILAHNDLGKVGAQVGRDLDAAQIAKNDRLQWRQVTRPDGVSVFEVYRKFSPSRHVMRERQGSMMPGRGFQRQQNQRQMLPGGLENPTRAIFVGLDMTPILEAQDADIRHAVILGVVLLLIGFAGMMLILLVQSNRVTKASLTRIKAFSDNVVENMPIGLIAIDNQNRIAACNHVAERTLELPVAMIIGKNAEQLLPNRLWEVVTALDAPDQVIEQEIDCTISGGRVVPLEIGASILRGEDGQFLGYVVLFKDLTEMRALRREIARSQRLASVGRLAAGVAHEIRNPLSSIKGFATYFKQRYPDAPQEQETANIMIGEIDRLNRVVGQLLEFAKPVAVSPKPTSLGDLIDKSVKIIEQQAKERQITLKTVNLAKMDTAVIDPDRISQVLLNLYLNAIESMEPGGELGIELSTDDGESLIQIKVSDTGSGIPEAHVSRIFDPYFTTKSTGTGLGLAIAHNIVEAMGGQINISSQPGKGTTFLIVIPTSEKA
ncbi:MAG: ATP-binding protein [Desulfobacterales bacterium]|jgi:two-component system sensor histidine kinase HydH